MTLVLRNAEQFIVTKSRRSWHVNTLTPFVEQFSGLSPLIQWLTVSWTVFLKNSSHLLPGNKLSRKTPQIHTLLFLFNTISLNSHICRLFTDWLSQVSKLHASVQLLYLRALRASSYVSSKLCEVFFLQISHPIQSRRSISPTNLSLNPKCCK